MAGPIEVFIVDPAANWRSCVVSANIWANVPMNEWVSFIVIEWAKARTCASGAVMDAAKKNRIDNALSRRRRTQRTFFGAAAIAVVMTVSGAASAKSVFLNGVNIDGVADQKFENVNVVIDSEGNILITAKGYDVKAAGPSTTSPAKATAGPVSRKYFLVSEANMPGMVQYDIDVFVNSVWVKRISHEDAQNVLDITPHMKKGKNVVHFTATKSIGEGRRSSSTGHTLKIILGEGNVGGNNVMIDNTLLEYARNAGEIRNFSNDFEVNGR